VIDEPEPWAATMPPTDAVASKAISNVRTARQLISLRFDKSAEWSYNEECASGR